MTLANKADLTALAPAWSKVQAHAQVRLQAITSERHYRGMSGFMDELLAEIGDDDAHPLAGLLDIVATFIEDYERRNHQLPESSPADVLRFLMDQHELRQADLADLFGAQSNVSEVLSGKRSINARQARALATRFGVSVEVFI